jgi:hypothetical protein
LEDKIMHILEQKKNLADDNNKTTTTAKELPRNQLFCCCWTMYNKTALLWPPWLQQQDYSPLPHHLREAQD